MASAWNEDRLARLCLGSFPGFGSRSLRKLREYFSGAQEAWLAPIALLRNAGIHEEAAIRFSSWRRSLKPTALLDALAAQDIQVVFPGELEYPQALAASFDPPEILFVRGSLADAPSVTVVGTRKMTSYGQRCVETIEPELVRSGLVIVSGLALGIDAAAHETALSCGGQTIAVLGTGVDDESLYPRANVALAHRIIKEGGAVISEFPPGSDSRKEHFPMRNRLLAALSQATVVIEAAEKSGSLITAKLALEENREVLAVPGPLWSAQSVGTNRLIQSGAKVCTCAKDVLDALHFDRPELTTQARANLPLDPIQERLLGAMEEPLHTDELGRLCGLDAASVSSHLALLELKGLIKSIGGQMWLKA